MVVEGYVGDYRFVFRKNSDGTFICERVLVDNSQPPEELTYWHELPPEMMSIFIKVRKGEITLSSQLKV